jgi:hypothetical protein
MKKYFNITHVMAILVVVITLSISIPSSISAYRGTWARFLGSVTLDRAYIPKDCQITLKIRDQEFYTNVYLKGSASWYVIDVPKDTGNGGGQDGDIVHFFVNINGIIYEDPNTAIWKTATDVSHPIRLKSNIQSNISIVTDHLPEGVVGSEYFASLDASGGTQPYTWSIDSGVLQSGLELSEDGIVYGVPEESGSINIGFKVTDALGLNKTKQFELRIWKLGDANHDGIVNKNDVYEVIRIYLGLKNPTLGADANQDGIVDLKDAIEIQKIYQQL